MARPKGSRNKTDAQSEIKKALSNGVGLIELKKFLWDRMTDEKVSDQQKAKFTQMYFDLMKYIHTENLKLESSSNETPESKGPKEIQKGENTEKSVSPSEGVVQMTFGKAK